MNFTPLDVVAGTGGAYLAVAFLLATRYICRTVFFTNADEKTTSIALTVAELVGLVLSVVQNAVRYTIAAVGNAFAALLSRWRLYLLTGLLACVGALTVEYHAEIIVEVDYAWTSVVWLCLEPFKHFLNFFRLFASAGVGGWDAVALLYRLPSRLAVRAAADCDISVSGLALDLARLIADFTLEFFAALGRWANSGLIADLDISLAIKAIRTFIETIVNLAACVCDNKEFNDTLRVLAYPAYTNSTDAVVASGVGLLARGVTFPFVAIAKPASGQDGLPMHDFINLMVREEGGIGLLAPGADLLNNWGQQMVEWLQAPLSFHNLPTLDFPPFFSILHHLVAAALEGVRVGVRLFETLPYYVLELVNGKIDNARVLMQRAFGAFESFEHLRRASHALFSRCVATVDKFLRAPEGAVGIDFGATEFGDSLHAWTVAVLHVGELLYNATVDFAIGHPDAVTNPKRDGCELKMIAEPFVDIIFTRFWNVVIVALGRWTDVVFPNIENACTLNGAFLAGFYAPYGETSAQFCLSLFHEIDAFAWSAGYALSRQVFGTTILSSCIEGFYEEAHEHERSFLAVMPSFLTALLDLKDTQNSGYATLACSKTTFRNHIYSGSLKMFIFANEACEASRDLFDHPERRGAYADFNTRTICAGSEAFVALLELIITQNRYMVEEVAGVLEVTSRCIAGINSDNCLKGPIVNQLDLLSLRLNAGSCLVAEFLYRVSEILISVISPIIDFTYGKYPDDGYVVSDTREYHIQAKPIQAALVTFLTSFFGAVHYGYRFVTNVNLKLVEIGKEFVTAVQKGDMATALDNAYEAVVKYRFEFNAMAVRSVILYIGDTLIGTLQVFFDDFMSFCFLLLKRRY